MERKWLSVCENLLSFLRRKRHPVTRQLDAWFGRKSGGKPSHPKNVGAPTYSSFTLGLGEARDKHHSIKTEFLRQFSFRKLSARRHCALQSQMSAVDSASVPQSKTK